MNSWYFILGLLIIGVAIGLIVKRVWRHYRPPKPQPPQPVTRYTK